MHNEYTCLVIQEDSGQMTGYLFPVKPEVVRCKRYQHGSHPEVEPATMYLLGSKSHMELALSKQKSNHKSLSTYQRSHACVYERVASLAFTPGLIMFLLEITWLASQMRVSKTLVLYFQTWLTLKFL